MLKSGKLNTVEKVARKVIEEYTFSTLKEFLKVLKADGK
jgi:hypothetical protein